ncbi:MAG: hypothetical protein M1823_000117 [Watsoniomyces obsoletus]|nr:MAG: hypothetical protein M1823_000117 [Watsoniomyces obsoletus]
MKATLLTLVGSLMLGADALTLGARDGTCCFHLTASGGVSGPVGQLPDGQNRVGGSYSYTPGLYCIGRDGTIKDGSQRGCILTEPTAQFQCDAGAQPGPSFSVGCDGVLSVGGGSRFYACPTGDQGSYNLYTRPAQGACVEVTLTADGCKSNCPAPPPVAPTTPAPPPPPPARKTCPTGLTPGAFEFPHLIVPVNSATPDQAYGTSYNGKINHEISSIFNFDIPVDDKGKTCSLVFLFPRQEDLITSGFTFSGSGAVGFSKLSGNADPGTTFKNAPGEEAHYGVTTIAPGNSYTIASFDCPAGQRITYKMASSRDTSLDYFQDYNPAP